MRQLSVYEGVLIHEIAFLVVLFLFVDADLIFPGEKLLPFETEDDRAALVGRKVFYVRRSDIVYMGGKPHVFPRSGVVKGTHQSAILMDDGAWIDATEIQSIVAA